MLPTDAGRPDPLAPPRAGGPLDGADPVKTGG